MAESNPSKFETQKIDGEKSIDRLSSLPDVLLLKILSYLPIRQAVATSILSNTWRALCRDRPSRKIYHSRSNPFEAIDTEWIKRAIIEGKVEILDVSLGFNHVPSSIFTCSTIVVPRLNGARIMNDIDSSVCLPSLKILHLNHVEFGRRENINKILHSGNTIVLEDLALNNITILVDTRISTRYHNVTSCFPKLIRANIDFDIYFPFAAFSNVESLRSMLFVIMIEELVFQPFTI
ncbi:F-box/RNI/FBD-like domain protein [Senna tora]|uniref:F-box/RNI/FBD-like domain protein n=1 Tax=Senna tora TaxID=362788 RepID=A0A834TQE7_9FABA|nr:F-box/RNI/FBD-like domain protein [Senna tora]